MSLSERCSSRLTFLPCPVEFSVGDQSLGDGPQKRALSSRFKSYCWIFTDELIDKLVGVRIKDAARARALRAHAEGRVELTDRMKGNSGFVLVEAVEEGDARARSREPEREQMQLKEDVLREITGLRSSKGLLLKVVGSWLPMVMAADKEGEEQEMARQAKHEMSAKGGTDTR